MPSFSNFTYYYAIDTLGVTVESLGWMSLWPSVSILVMPAFYAIVLRATEYRKIFLIAQVAYIFAYLLLILLANDMFRHTLRPLIYFLSSSFVAPAE